jgi:mannose-6-phosphate isomerase
VSVTEPPKYATKPFESEKDCGGYISQRLCQCDLFTVDRYAVKTAVTLETDESSFNHILVIDGSGSVNGSLANKGDSFLVPANFGKYELRGEIEVLITKI